ncbi:MAG: hypothetical protein H6573_14650 [Lewinellaceae bacterium]|nr:hypothetical protein [Phaeodactylibacter sp.]MCB0614023.1 hypothetical protein [Phaeodactylibacter sp.]MCB9348725.1 hypothetical protein [Lewinellaceae bacterium]
MYRIIILFLFIGALSSCSRDKGKTQGDLQRIYLAINEGQLEQANDMLVPENKLSASPLESDGYTKELYGQVHVLETVSIGDDEMIIYKLEKHERNRGVLRRMDSEDFKERRAAGEVKSVNEDSGIIVYTERQMAFRVKMADGEYRYIIDPTEKALNVHFPNKRKEVERLVAKYFPQG